MVSLPQTLWHSASIDKFAFKTIYKNVNFSFFCSEEMEIIFSKQISEVEKHARSQLFKYIIYISHTYLH